MCPFHSDGLVGVSNQNVMPQEDFAKLVLPVISQAEEVQFGCIHEPTIVPYFDFVVQSVAKARPRPENASDAWCSMVTNAMPLTEKKMSLLLLSGMISSIKLSCDGIDAEIYEKIRIGAKFNVFMDRLSMARRIIDENHLPIKIYLIFTLQPTNYHQYYHLEEWAKSNGVDELIIHGLSGFLATDETRRQYLEIAGDKALPWEKPPEEIPHFILKHDCELLDSVTSQTVGNLHQEPMESILGRI